MKVKWNKFDYDNEDTTRPTENYKLYWIIEEFYYEEMLGYFDGYTWRIWNGSDDSNIAYWAEIGYPDPPENYQEQEDARRSNVEKLVEE